MTHVAGTEPYPWPYDGRLEGAHLALVFAGWDEHWHRAAVDADAPVRRCHALAAAVLDVGGGVLTITHRGAPPLGGPGPFTVVASDGIDGFFDGPLDGVLRRAGRTHLLLAGLGLEGPVHSTLRSANDRGYEALLVTDACAALTTDLAAAAARTVTMSGGIFGAVGESGPVLAALASAATSTPALEKEPA